MHHRFARSGLSKKELEEECAARGGEWVAEFQRIFFEVA